MNGTREKLALLARAPRILLTSDFIAGFDKREPAGFYQSIMPLSINLG